MTTNSEVQDRTGVAIVGSISVDLVAYSPRMPEIGETILGEAFEMILGGKGANQAIAAARAGARTEMIGCVGTDPFREVALSGLREFGVGLTHVHAVDGPTGIAHIRVDHGGQNNIVVAPLANAHLDVQHVTAALERCAATCAVLLVQLETPPDVVLGALEFAAAHGIRTILDPAPAAELGDEYWKHTFAVTPNESEAQRLTGIEVTDFESAVAAGQWFLQRGTEVAIITLAVDGAVVVTRDGSQIVSAFTVEAVDSTAAGDTFAGYLGAAIARGESLSTAVQQANAAGALSVTVRGASSSIPARERVQEFLEQH